MPEKNTEIKKMEERISKLDAQQKQLKAKKRALRNRISQQNRKARTKRLIEKGAILEKFQGENADKISADASLTDLNQLKNDRDNFKNELDHVKNQFESLKAFSTGVTYAQQNPNEPVHTVFGNWEDQENAKK